jgi:Dolichyl-phosphate-mannose-protein mannosyltransferase
MAHQAQRVSSIAPRARSTLGNDDFAPARHHVRSGRDLGATQARTKEDLVQLTAVALTPRGAERAWPTLRAVALPAITALAALIRFRGLWASPGVSEVRAMRLAVTPPGQLLSDGLAPGYYILLGQWMAHFGAALPVLRLPGALASTLCVVGVYAVVAPQSTRTTGLLAALAAAVLPIWVLAGQQVGPLPFTLLTGLLSTWVLGRAIRSTSPWTWLAYLVLITACLYTSAAAILVVVAQVAWILIRWPDLRAWQRLAFAVVLADALLACSTWLRGLPVGLQRDAMLALLGGLAVVLLAALLPPAGTFPPLRPSRRGMVGGLVAVAVLALSLVPTLAFVDGQRQELTGAVAYIEQHAEPRDAVLVAAGVDTDSYLYVAHDNLPLYDTPSATDPGPSSRLQDIAVGRRHLWLVSAGGAEWALVSEVRRALSTFGARPRALFSNHLVAFDLTASEAAPEQSRPPSVQERREIDQQSLTLRYPFDAAAAAPGAQWHVGNEPVGAPRPRSLWYFPAGPQYIDDARLNLFNPHAAPITAKVEVRTITVVMRKTVHLRPRQDLEVELAPLSHDSVSEVIVRAAAPVVATRTQIDGTSLAISAGLTAVPPPNPLAEKPTP